MDLRKTKLAFSTATAQLKKKRKLYDLNSEIAKNVTESKGPPAARYLYLITGENIKNVYLNF